MEVRRVYLVTLWLAEFGGMECHLTELALALRRNGIDVHVFIETPVPRRNQYRLKLKAAGIPVWSPKVPAWVSPMLRHLRKSGLYRSLSRFQNLVFDRWSRKSAGQAVAGATGLPDQMVGEGMASAWLRRAMETRAAREKPDVVHIHGVALTHAWIAKWATDRGLPVVYTEHSTLGDWEGPWSAIAERLAATACGIACVSNQSRASLEPLFPGRDIAIHRHILTAEVERTADRTSTGPVRLITVARLREEKGIDVLLRASAQVRERFPGFRLVIVGGGPDRQKLEKLCAELGLKQVVEFAGQQPAAEVTARLRQAEVFVLASRTEAMPISVLEAMAHGLAIVATQVGGIPEMIRNGDTGRLVPPDCPEALGDALEAVIGDHEERQRLRHASRLAFERGPHSEQAALRILLASYEEAELRGRSHSRPDRPSPGPDAP